MDELQSFKIKIHTVDLDLDWEWINPYRQESNLPLPACRIELL